MRTPERPGAVAFRSRALGLLIIVGVLLGACSGVRPTLTDAPGSETPAVSVGARNQTNVTVAWTAPAAELTPTGYDLQWRSDGDAARTTVTGLASTETSYTITGLQPETTYEVRVRAVFAMTVGSWSEPVTVSTTAAPSVPSAADGPRLSESATDSNSMSVTWTVPVTNETITSYELNWRSSADVDWIVVTSISSTATSHTIDGLQPQTTYEVRVRAAFGAIAGAWSESITVSTTASERPTLSQTAASGTSITVTWAAPAPSGPITGYELNWRVLTHYPDLTRLRASNSGRQWIRVTGIASTAASYTITRLQPRSVYEVRVRAMFRGGAGRWSANLSCNTDAYLYPPIAGFFCPCRFTVSEAAAGTGKEIGPSNAVAAYFTAETFPPSIRYEVTETGDMLEPSSRGVFKTPPKSLEGVSYTYYVVYPRIPLQIDDDDVDEPDSTVTVRILPDPRYQVAVESSVKVTITDDD